MKQNLSLPFPETPLQSLAFCRFIVRISGGRVGSHSAWGLFLWKALNRKTQWKPSQWESLRLAFPHRASDLLLTNTLWDKNITLRFIKVEKPRFRRLNNSPKITASHGLSCSWLKISNLCHETGQFFTLLSHTQKNLPQYSTTCLQKLWVTKHTHTLWRVQQVIISVVTTWKNRRNCEILHYPEKESAIFLLW